MDARCQCGQIQFTTPLPKPVKVYICHCTECRHQSSSAFGITATFPHFTIQPPVPGALAIHSRPNSIGFTNGYFCTKCGSRLLHEHVSATGEPESDISVKGGCLVGITREMMRGAVHIWTKSAIIDIPPDVEQYEGEPPEDV